MLKEKRPVIILKEGSITQRKIAALKGVSEKMFHDNLKLTNFCRSQSILFHKKLP